MRGRPLLFDSSVYIGIIRGAIEWSVIAVPMRDARVRLASVVAFELLVGARTAADRQDLAAMIQRSEQSGWTITPGLRDWTTAADMVAWYGRRHGRLEPRDHLADVLLVLCAGQVQGEIVTTNVRDLSRWARVARRFNIAVGVSSVG